MLLTSPSAEAILNAATHISVISIGADGTILSFGKGSELLTGYTAEEMVGKKRINHLLDPQELQDHIAFIRKSYPGSEEDLQVLTLREYAENPHPRTWTYIKKDGSRLFMSIALSVIYDNGRYVGNLAIGHDITARVEAEREIAETNKLIRSIADTLPDALFVYDLQNHKTLFINAQIANILGYSVSEFISWSIDERNAKIYPDDRQNAVDYFNRFHTLADGETNTVEYRFLNKAGEYRWLRNRSTVFKRDAAGKAWQSIGTTHDITVQKRALSDLEWSNKRFELLAEASNSGIIDWDLQTKKVQLGTQWCRMLHYSEPEFTEAELSELVHPADRENYKNTIERFINGTHDSETFQFRLRNGKGEYRWLERSSRLLRNEQGIPVKILGTSTDVTQRKNAEALINRQSNILEALLNNLDAIAVSIGPDGTVTEAKGRGLRLIHNPDLNNPDNEHNESMVRCMAEYGPKAMSEGFAEFTCSAYNGQQNKTFHFRHFLLRDNEGGLIDFSLDITEAVEHQQVLEASRAAADAANRAKSEFLANMSHELRTPLNGIYGFTDFLLHSGLNQEQTEYVNTIAYSSQTLLTLIEDILDFSKIEAGKLKLNPVPFSLRPELDKILKMLTPAAIQKNIELTCTTQPGMPDRFIGDLNRIKQILVNLLGNAVKFTLKGSVSVRVEQGESINSSATALKIYITDTGIGIAPEKLESIFRPFEQAEGSISRSYGGTGLGLTISGRLAALMGGKLSVTSNLGKGSTFLFETELHQAKSAFITEPADLPYSGKSLLAEPVFHTPQTGQPQQNVQLPKVLIAEDNQINRKLAERMMKRLGYEVFEAENGEEAANLFSSVHFDLVLMDVQMPGTDGLEATRRIRLYESKQTDGRHVPVIALTANALEGDGETCLNAGMDAYLKKPVKLEVLKAEIERLTGIVALG